MYLFIYLHKTFDHREVWVYKLYMPKQKKVNCLITSVGQRMQKLLTTNDLAGILRLKPIQE